MPTACYKTQSWRGSERSRPLVRDCCEGLQSFELRSFPRASPTGSLQRVAGSVTSRDNFHHTRVRSVHLLALDSHPSSVGHTEADGSHSLQCILMGALVGTGRVFALRSMTLSRANQSCRVSIVTFVYRSHCVHLSFLKPIWAACSLKHLLQIMSSYFLMRPSELVQQRHARESFPYFLGWECCWWGIFYRWCVS